MGADLLSPIAPARVRVLLLPVGRIKRSRFMTFVQRLQQECVVRLGDISPDGRPDKSTRLPNDTKPWKHAKKGVADHLRLTDMFSPMAFPNGSLLYHFSTSTPPAAHLALAPFELFRGPMLVMGIVDASEYRAGSQQGQLTAPGSLREDLARDYEELEGIQERLSEQYPRVLMTQLLLMDWSGTTDGSSIPKGALCVPPVTRARSTTLKTIMCDISARFLAEMTIYAKAVQSLPSVQSPGAQGAVPSYFSDRPGLSRQDSIRSVSSWAESPSATPKQLPANLPLRNVTTPSTNTSGGSRPGSPVGPRAPPTSFDEIANASVANGLSRSISRSSNHEGRTSSRDRTSTQGLTSSSAREKARIKGKARVGIVVGSLYLMAGHWSDAWRELVESTNKARSVSDHLWHAKGIENLLACMLLFSWAGFDFQIPQVCISGFERSSSLDLFKDVPQSLGLQDAAAATKARQRLAKALPDVVATILSFYDRANSQSGEPMPPVAHSEMILRLTKLLTLLLNAGSELGTDLLNNIIQGSTAQQPLRRKSRAIIMPGLTKHWIVDVLFQAWPIPSSGLTIPETITILSGVATVLSMLQLERKKAIVLKELVAMLVPALVQARRLGAAEMGIHPAASLAMIGGGGNDGPMGVESLLRQLHSTYGTAVDRVRGSNGNDSQNAPIHKAVTDIEDILDAAVSEALHRAGSSELGSLNLKLDILRACIEFSEALPDPAGLVQFIGLLLRCAGPNAAIDSTQRDRHVSLSNEEQIRMLSAITRTTAHAVNMGGSAIAVPYWDDFLIRDVRLLERESSTTLVEHSRKDLEAQKEASKTPFLYDPFTKKTDKLAEEQVVVAGEIVDLMITLQNPYDFEVIIESLQLATDGNKLLVQDSLFTLGPSRMQQVRISGTAASAGTLSISGCHVRIRGCLARFFPIYREAWAADHQVRIKSIGVQPVEGADPHVREPKTCTLPMTVIPSQPQITVEDLKLPESALMVLEGERMAFQVLLRNTSASVSTDFLHVSFEDSLTASIQAALGSKSMSRAAIYDLEMQLSRDPIFKWERLDDGAASVIEPGQVATFEISVVGRPGLGAARILFDFAHLGKSSSEFDGRFFTRQVAIPIDITVNASVQVHRADIAPFPTGFAWTNHRRRQAEAEAASRAGTPRTRRSSPRAIEKGSSRFRPLLGRVGLNEEDEEHCLLLLDLRNAWPSPLVISVDVRESLATTGDHADGEWKRAYTGHEVIHPGHIARLVLLLPRIHLANPHAPIPALSRQSERQFVVGNERASPTQERAAREAFWYREEILKHLRGMWKEEGSERLGDLNLRDLRLTPRMVDAVRLEDVSIEMSVTPAPDVTAGVVRQIGRSRFEVRVDEFLTLHTKIRNRSDAPLRCVLRLQPTLTNQQQDSALDVGRRVMWTGLLQRPLAVLQPKQTLEVDLGLCVLASGDFEVGATLEEVKAPEMQSATKRPNEDLEELKVFGNRERRIWHAREACSLHAKAAV